MCILQIDNLQQDQDSMNTHLMRQEEVMIQVQGQVESREVCQCSSDPSHYQIFVNKT